MTEIFRPVVGFEGLYEVSNCGTVRSTARQGTDGRVVICHVQKNGYRKAHLYKAGKRQARWVHALVAEAFIGKRPLGMLVCHGDGDPLNNRVDNLRWDTAAANYDDARQHGTAAIGERNHSFKLTAQDRAEIIASRPLGKRAPNGLRAQLAERFGVTRTTITEIWGGRA